MVYDQDSCEWVNVSSTTSLPGCIHFTYVHFAALWTLSGIPQVSQYQNQSGFYWSKRQWVAVASAGPYAILHLVPDNHASTPSPNQQRQSTEGTG